MMPKLMALAEERSRGSHRRGQTVDLGGGAAVDILTLQECLLHLLVPCNMGQDAQLDLAVIRIHQHPAGTGYKVGPQLAAQLGADGDILQVRGCPRTAARCGLRSG